MKNSINLLPEWVQNSQQWRNLWIKIVAIQVVIFVFISIFFNMLISWEARLNLLIDQTEVLVIPTIPEEILSARTLAELIDENIEEFKSLWLIAIINTVPESTRLTQLYYRNSVITLTAITNNLIDIETHQQNLADTLLFEWILAGRIIGIRNGMYDYELRIGVIRN